MSFKLPAWLVGSGRRPAVDAPASPISWHREQAGEAAARLKPEWVQLLRLNPLVKKAFFASATLAEGESARPVLVLVSTVRPDEAWLAGLTRLADQAMPDTAPLAVQTLGPKACAPLERVCRPFYYSV